MQSYDELLVVMHIPINFGSVHVLLCLKDSISLA